MALRIKSSFLNDKAYENYLKSVRKRKNYQFYNEFVTRLINDGIEIREALQLVMMVHNERDLTKGYHYSWYSKDALECIHLIEEELTGKIR